MPRSQSSQSSRGFTPITESSRLPGGVMQGPQHGLQAIFICYAADETAALGCSLRPLLTYPLQGRTSSRLLPTGNPRPGGEILIGSRLVRGLSFAAPYANLAQS